MNSQDPNKNMDPGIIIVLLILLATVILLVLDVVRIDILAIGCMLALGWKGILTPPEMLQSFRAMPLKQC